MSDERHLIFWKWLYEWLERASDWVHCKKIISSEKPCAELLENPMTKLFSELWKERRYSMDTPFLSPEAYPGSLRGANVRPMEGGHFSGVIAIPIGFRNEGETDNQVVLRYLDFLDEQDEVTL